MSLSLLTSFHKDQDKKLALIADANSILEPTLNPIELMPPVNDQVIKDSMAAAVPKLRQAAGNSPAKPAADARRLPRHRLADDVLLHFVHMDQRGLDQPKVGLVLLLDSRHQQLERLLDAAKLVGDAQARGLRQQDQIVAQFRRGVGACFLQFLLFIYSDFVLKVSSLKS